MRISFQLVMASLGALLVLLWGSSSEAAAASVFAPIPDRPSVVFTNPIILVTPKVLRFGAVPAGKSATNTFLVENLGHGQLVGTASVSAPFKILSSEGYALKRNEVQVVKVEYAPGSARTNAAVVTFTGGGGAKATVTGRRAGGRD